MSILSWIRNRFPRRKAGDTSNSHSDTRREFVYLDEVSVYSILASRKDGIATQFTETQTYSLNSELSSSAGVGFSATRAKLDSKIQAGQVQGSQVLRKAIIQSSFKELYDIERPDLALRARVEGDVPKVRDADDLLRILGDNSGDGWLVDASTIHRGDLLEVHVELAAEPIFQMATLITAFSELTENKEVLFGRSITSQVSEMQAMAHLLDSMLVGLVPIRGRLLDYDCLTIEGREVLIHRSLLNEIEGGAQLQTQPAVVVGVAQGDLFWKDIRRVLFSRAPYTLFCRLATSGLTDTWNPIKFADVLTDIAPSFGEMVRKFNEEARLAMKAAPDVLQEGHGENSRGESEVIRCYTALLAGHHGAYLEPGVVDDLVLSMPRREGWLDSVDGRRPVFAHVTNRVDTELGVETPNDVAYELRNTAVNSVISIGTPATQMSRSGDGRTPLAAREEKFLDAEIVAIYW